MSIQFSGGLDGRDSCPSARRSQLIRKKERLENQLAAIDARAQEQRRKRDTRLKVIVGAAVLAHARLDAAFAAKLNQVLLCAVVRPNDRAFLFSECNAWRGAESELTKSRKGKPKQPDLAVEPTPVERRNTLKTGPRYQELKQL